MKRTCPHCQQIADYPPGVDAVCPHCQRASDDRDSSLAAQPVAASPAIGMTIQAGRWSPSPEELDEAARNSPPGFLQTLMTSGFLGSSESKVDTDFNELTNDLSNPDISPSPFPVPAQPSSGHESVGRIDATVDSVDSVNLAGTVDSVESVNLAGTVDSVSSVDLRPEADDGIGATVDSVDAIGTGSQFIGGPPSSASDPAKRDAIDATVDSVANVDLPPQSHDSVGSAPALGATVDSVDSIGSVAGVPAIKAKQTETKVDSVGRVDATVDSVDSISSSGSQGVVRSSKDNLTVRSAGQINATVDSVAGEMLAKEGGAINATVDSVDSISSSNQSSNPLGTKLESKDQGQFSVGSASLDRAGFSLGGSIASRAAEAASSHRLEETLVIQHRVLRPEPEDGKKPTEKIDYNLLQKLGEGGMGIVFAARQQSIRRVVALKMLKARGEGTVVDMKALSQREKFLAEAVITGDLEHPNIVPIYDLGRDDKGAIFYAMKHVKGIPWDKQIGKKTIQENLEVLMKVADAVAFAHSKRVIHRDLKPENVMLGDFGEVLVMDWGLAISVDAAAGSVNMGGTPAYMAPEMVTGPISALGFHSDVYLLGAMLYEMTTGLRPHSGESITKCLLAASTNQIVPTTKTGELVQIALKALATKPADRYPGVVEFQDAIRSYLAHTESIALAVRAGEDFILAQENQRYENFARALFGYQEAVALWDGNEPAKRGASEVALTYAKCAQQREDYELGLSLLNEHDPEHASVIAQLRESQRERDQRVLRLKAARRLGVAMAASIFLIVTGAFFWIRMEAARARDAESVALSQRAEAMRQTSIAVEQTSIAERQKTVAETERAAAVAARQEEQRQREAAVAAQMAEQTARTLAETKRMEADAARAEEEVQRKLAVVARQQEEYEAYIAKIGLAAAKIEENAFDRATTLIDECPPHLRNWEWGRLKYLSSRQTHSHPLSMPIEALALSPDGSTIAVGGWGNEVYLLSPEQPDDAIRKLMITGDHVFALAFSPDGSQLAIGSNSSLDYLSIWDVAKGAKTLSLDGHTDAVLSIVWDADGQRLLTGSYDNTARLWDIASGQSREFLGHDWWVWSAKFSPDETQVVTASQDGSALVWDVANATSSAPLLGHQGPVYCATFSPDGRRIVTAGYDQRIMLWDAQRLPSQDLKLAITKNLSEKSADPLRRTAQTSSSDSPSTDPNSSLLKMLGHTAAVRSATFSSDGRLILSSSNDNTIGLWDSATGMRIKELRGHAQSVPAAIFFPGDLKVLSGSYDQTVKIWDIPQYEEIRVLGGRMLGGHRDAILGGAFSPDGKTVVTASRDRSAIAWDVATGKPIQSYTEGHEYLASTALFFPRGKRILTAAIDNTARIWDLTTGTQLFTLPSTGIHAAAAIAPSGDWIATGSDSQSIQIWGADGQPLRQFTGLTTDISAIAISPDGQYLLTGDSVGRCRLVDSQSGESIWESRTHSRAITQVDFAPSGDHVLSASLDRVVAIRDARTGEEDRARLLKHPGPITSFAMSADGRTVLTSCGDNIVRQWDFASGTLVRQLPTDTDTTTSVAIAADHHTALTTTAGQQVRLWDLRTGKELPASQSGQGVFLDLASSTIPVWSGTFSPGGDQILTVGGAEARLWDARTAEPLITFSPQAAVSSVQFASTGDRFVTGSWDNSARIWDTASGSALVKLSGKHTRFVNASAFSPDGTRVITASDDATVQMWDASTGMSLGAFIGHSGRVTDVAFSADGTKVLTASEDKTARIWDAETFKPLHSLQGHSQGVLCGRFSADGKRVITGSDDTTAKLWDAQTGESLPITLDGHTASITAVAFSPDGKRVITASSDISSKLWDPETGKEVLTLTGHSQGLTTVVFSGDGRSILTGSRDGTAIVWLSEPWDAADTK